MAFAFIGESVASGIIGKLAEVACNVVGERLFPEASDIEADLERIKFALPQIQEVLGLAEWDEIKNRNKAMTAWMWQFRDAVECAEDVLDEMEYYELEEKVQSNNGKVDLSASSSKRKFSEFVGNKLKADHNGILGRLQKAVKGLDKVASTVPTFLEFKRGLSGVHGENSNDNSVQNDRETGSMITESVVFGREKERDSIVEWLTVDPSVGDAPLSAFTICGIGGLGKTTLAQLIYNDEKVKQFFDEIMWVCVSDQFTAATIIAKALHMPKESYLTTVQDKLKERLRSKRFLLVLDDVWDDKNRDQWEKLVAPLKFGQGKVLVTTRMESVADMIAKVIEGKTDRLKLKGLEDDKLYMLLSKHAFDGADPDEFRNLYPIGKQIAKKLGGCPLAAKIMGGVLNYSIEFDFWNKVLKENLPEFKAGKDEIIGVLRLSYFHLPINLQVCFRYCSIFPKDYQFKKSELIKMWMGSGLIEPLREGQLPEDVGREYFNRLVRKSFFDLKWVDGGAMEEFYVMHDLLHDLAQSVSEGECLRIEGNSSDIPITIRHLGFNTKSLFSIREISHLKRLHTLFISCESGNHYWDEMSSEGLESLTSLRLLRIISNCRFYVPDEIPELIHLRYLSLSMSYKQKEHFLFPKSICKLYHLQLFSFNECEIKEDEANGIVNLIKLRYLDVGSKIITQITNIGRLVFLQELEPLNIGPESGHMISELKDLRGLRKLTITNLHKISNPVEAKDAKLYEKKNLIKLSLIWSHNENHHYAGVVHEQLIDNLQPHNHLQKLSINGYEGMRSPIWMTHFFLVNLIALQLYHCCYLESLPALGKLPMLKELRLGNLKGVKKIDETFYGHGTECAFPVLKVLMLEGMDELEDWDEAQGITPFPRLESLYVWLCDKLRRLPSLPPSIKRLDISNVGLEILPRIYPHYKNGLIVPSSLSYLSVRYCLSLTSLDGSLLQQQQEMQTLSELHIENCTELMHVTSRGLLDSTSQRERTQDNLLPYSLQRLTIGHCGLDVPLLSSIRNCTALTLLKLVGCPHISSLPPFEILKNLISLDHLNIWDCPELSSLGGLQALISLRYLYISGCDKLTDMSHNQPPLPANANDSNPLGLNVLLIDKVSLLRLEPLRSLKLTKGLHIIDASDLTCMPEEWLRQNNGTLCSIEVRNGRSLELLPSCMRELSLLERLEVYGAPLIQSLPDLPSSLKCLRITGCHPVLKERYKENSGPEWSKIAFIPDVNLV